MTGTREGAVPLSPEVQRALEGLRDLQSITVLHPGPALAGEAVPAGVVLAFALLLVSGLIVAVFVWRRGRVRRALLGELRKLREASAGRFGPAQAAGLERLLRLAAAAGKRQVRCPACSPGLAGEAWLAWLDAQAPVADRGRFVAGPGRLLATLPFARAGVSTACSDEPAELVALCERWLRANLK